MTGIEATSLALALEMWIANFKPLKIEWFFKPMAGPKGEWQIHVLARTKTFKRGFTLRRIELAFVYVVRIMEDVLKEEINGIMDR